jgi:hypothetical protein
MLTRAKTFVAAIATVATVAAGSLAVAPSAQAGQYYDQGSGYYDSGWGPYHHRRHNPYRYGYYHDDGSAVALGIIGLIAGSLLANGARPLLRDASYCAQRFRSWDSGSRTYLGFDGLRHPCG